MARALGFVHVLVSREAAEDRLTVAMDELNRETGQSVAGRNRSRRMLLFDPLDIFVMATSVTSHQSIDYSVSTPTLDVTIAHRSAKPVR